MKTGNMRNVKRIFGASVFLPLFILISVSQTSQQSGRTENRTGTSLERIFDQGNRSMGNIMPQPFEETIDESEYIVGPNDVFTFQIPGISTSFVQLLVTPEGKLVIPGGREFDAGGKSLREVKKEVVNSFKAVKPSLTLFAPRQFVVTVLGKVEKPGTYVTSSVLRVDRVLAQANPQSGVAADPALRPYSTRRIILRRKGVPDQIVDLDRYYAFRRSRDNPFLREGDIVVVPPRAIEQAAVSVYGAVNVPSQYEFREEDSLGAMIRVAQGLTPAGDSTNVELTRFSQDGTSSRTTVFDISGILRRIEPDVPLQNKDRILVREKPDPRGDFKVHVRGEVRLPGMYPITRDSTRLSEIIARAGGFTASAYLRSAEIERKQLGADGSSMDLSREAMLNLRMSDQLVTPEERAYYDLESTLRRGTVAADFVGLFERNDPSKDVLLKDGDIIFVPNSRKTVYVYGQVARPGYVVYKEGADVRYYIQQAGGYGEEAEGGETRVIKFKTREWMDPSDTTIEPGDYVWVPKDIHYPTAYYLNLVSQAASFVSVVLSMTVIILQLTKN